MADKTVYFLSSQHLYLPEIDVIKYRNDLMNAFGLNTHQVAVNTANDALGNIYRQILIDKEAYARYLKQLVAPIESLTKTEQERQDTQQAQESLSLSNAAAQARQVNVTELREMLLMFAQYFYLQEMMENELLLKLEDAKNQEERVRRIQAALDSQVSAGQQLPSAYPQETMIALHQGYLDKIRTIDAKIQQTNVKLGHVRQRKQHLSQQIQSQQNTVQTLQTQITQRNQQMTQIDQLIDAAQQNYQAILAEIDTHKQLKQEKKQELNTVRVKKGEFLDKVKGYDEEIDTHDLNVEKLEEELQDIKQMLKDSTLASEERERLHKIWYEKETEHFIEQMYGFVARNDMEETEEVLKKISEEEHVIEEHIGTIKEKIKSLKHQAKEVELDIQVLNQRRSAIAAEAEALQKQLGTEQSVLDRLVSEYDNLARQESLLDENVKALTELAQIHQRELELTMTLQAINKNQPVLQAKLEKNQHKLEMAERAIEGLSQDLERKIKEIEVSSEKLKQLDPHSSAYKKLSVKIDKLNTARVTQLKKIGQQSDKKFKIEQKVNKLSQEIQHNKHLEQDALSLLQHVQTAIHRINSEIDQREQQAHVLGQQLSPAPQAAKSSGYHPGFQPKYQQSSTHDLAERAKQHATKPSPTNPKRKI